jgi:hypothetical protein
MGPQPKVATVVKELLFDWQLLIDLGTQSGATNDALVVLRNGDSVPAEFQQDLRRSGAYVPIGCDERKGSTNCLILRGLRIFAP